MPTPSKKSTATPSHSPATNVRRAKLDAAREKLLDGGLYLGDTKLKHEVVVWKRVGNDDCLVTKESADLVDEFHTAGAAAAQENAEDLETTIPEPNLSPAIFSMAIHITSDDFWMTPCGNWKGPTSFCEKFSDMKLSCTGISPLDPPFSDDYTIALKNLLKLTEECAKFKSKRGLFWERNGERKIKFRHVLFEVCILPIA